MARPTTPHPTPAEVMMLRVIWKKGDATVRDVFNAVKRERKSGYNSTLKLMQIMEVKGYIVRKPNTRPARYIAKMNEKATRERILRDLAKRLFGGSLLELSQFAAAM